MSTLRVHCYMLFFLSLMLLVFVGVVKQANVTEDEAIFRVRVTSNLKVSLLILF